MDSELRNGFGFDGFEVYPLRNEIIGARGAQRMLPRTMDVLCCLAAYSGNVVDQETILTEAN